MADMVQDDPVNVLLVDDQPGKLLSYQVMLEELGENLIPVNSAQEALAFLLKSEVAVILVDVCMPDLDGFELAKMIREHPRFQKTAIIFISAVHMSETDYLRGYEAGAVDYLSVPVVPELLRAKVRVFAELFRKTRQLHQLNGALEQRVEERTKTLSLALAAGYMGAWTWERAEGTWVWDEGQSRIFGTDHRRFSGSAEKFSKYVHVDDVEKLNRAMASLSLDKNSFELELRVVRPDGELRWCRVVGAAILDSRNEVARISGVTTDITERKEAEGKQMLLTREVDHRAKNALAVVQAIVRLARRDNVDEYIKGVEGRINALAQTHDLLSQARWEGADLLRLVLDEMAPYQTSAERVTVIGPSMMVSPADAQTLAIALHELATNAAKYGALSVEAGRVEIAWSFFEGKLKLTWTESAGPSVRVPQTKGFGTKIINASFSDARRSKVAFDWRPEGLCCQLELDIGARENAAEKKAQKHQSEQSELRRILLVEDEPLVGIFMENVLTGLGFSAETCQTLEDGIEAVKQGGFEGAILDMNLNGTSVYPLADMLTAMDVPFVFVTGYSGDSVDRRFASVPLLQKPVEEKALAAALKTHFAPREDERRRA